MTDTSLLLQFCRESTEYVEHRRLNYYWQAGDYKFHNKLLVSWFEAHYNTWANYVTPVAQVQLGINNPQTELEFAASFAGQKTRLLLSGGRDSNTILERLMSSGAGLGQAFICLDSIDGVDTSDVNAEQIMNAVPLLARYKSKIGSVHWQSLNQDYYLKLYNDPYVRLRMPRGARFYNFLIDRYEELIDPDDGYVNIVGLEKPTVVYLDGRWYATFFDTALDSRISVPNAVYWWLEPGNISEWVRGAVQLRERLFGNRVKPTDRFRIFDASSSDLVAAEAFNDALDRVPLSKPVNLGKGFHGEFLNMREKLYISKLLHTPHVELLYRYHESVGVARSVFPGFEWGSSPADNKFGFFVDLDSHQVYTQEQVMTERVELS